MAVGLSLIFHPFNYGQQVTVGSQTTGPEGTVGGTVGGAVTCDSLAHIAASIRNCAVSMAVKPAKQTGASGPEITHP